MEKRVRGTQWTLWTALTAMQGKVKFPLGAYRVRCGGWVGLAGVRDSKVCSAKLYSNNLGIYLCSRGYILILFVLVKMTSSLKIRHQFAPLHWFFSNVLTVTLQKKMIVADKKNSLSLVLKSKLLCRDQLKSMSVNYSLLLPVGVH